MQSCEIKDIPCGSHDEIRLRRLAALPFIKAAGGNEASAILKGVLEALLVCGLSLGVGKHSEARLDTPVHLAADQFAVLNEDDLGKFRGSDVKTFHEIEFNGAIFAGDDALLFFAQ